MIPQLETLGNTLRDVLVLTYLFVLRIGVPLLITWGVGYWLRRKLEATARRPVPTTEKAEAEPESAKQVVV